MDKSDFLALSKKDRPRVRVTWRGQHGLASLIPDGNSVWLVLAGSKPVREFRVSWGLALSVINDPRSPGIEMDSSYYGDEYAG